jgi:hypothetical protein
MKTYKQYPAPPGKSKENLKPGKYYRSWRDDKKLVIRVKKGNKDKLVHFGHPDYKDYTQHKDKERRKNYIARASFIKDGDGKLTKNDPFSANYHSMRVLWNYKK